MLLRIRRKVAVYIDVEIEKKRNSLGNENPARKV
jgi:hypothetical protein